MRVAQLGQLLPVLLLKQATSFHVISPSHHLQLQQQQRKSFLDPLQAESNDGGDDNSGSNVLRIEYCTGCRWMLKSFWLAQELLTTFDNDLDAVTIVPSRPPAPGGIFQITLNEHNLLWDRKEEGGFPSPKGLKQIVRDLVAPTQFLGHSDTEDRQGASAAAGDQSTGTVERSAEDIPTTVVIPAPSPSVTISYCTGCRWLLRAAYFGQELLTTFDEDINSVTLLPSKPPAKGGKFSIELDGTLLFDRAQEGRFPEVKEVKQMIRDKLAPSKDLGHSDKKEELDEDEAAAQRRLFGVE